MASPIPSLLAVTIATRPANFDMVKEEVDKNDDFVFSLMWGWFNKDQNGDDRMLLLNNIF